MGLSPFEGLPILVVQLDIFVIKDTSKTFCTDNIFIDRLGACNFHFIVIFPMTLNILDERLLARGSLT